MSERGRAMRDWKNLNKRLRVARARLSGALRAERADDVEHYTRLVTELEDAVSVLRAGLEAVPSAADPATDT